MALEVALYLLQCDPVAGHPALDGGDRDRRRSRRHASGPARDLTGMAAASRPRRATQPPERLRARVRDALRAAAERLAGPFVRTAFFAAVERSPAVRRLAADRACFASAGVEAAARLEQQRQKWPALRSWSCERSGARDSG